MKRLVGVLLAYLVVGCQPTHPLVIIEAKGTQNCAAACGRLARLGCPEGLSLEDGTSCTEFCEKTQRNGHPLNPNCVMGIETCSDLASCTEN